MEQLQLIWSQLGIDPKQIDHLPKYSEASDLQDAGRDCFGRPQRLYPATVDAWHSMVKAAENDEVMLEMVSAYRSYEYQASLIQKKLQQGLDMSDILKVVVAPGCSEHHTGRAVDISTPGFDVLTEDFEKSSAYEWLSLRAKQFGFTLSFPKGNPYGVIYEPWHWAWSEGKSS